MSFDQILTDSLLKAIKDKDFSTIEDLLSSHSPATFTARQFMKGDTPLHIAVRYASLESLQVLTKHLDIDTKNNDGKTALHEAAVCEDPVIAKYLIDHGATADYLKMADW